MVLLLLLKLKDLSVSSTSESDNTTAADRALSHVNNCPHTVRRRVDFVPDNRGNSADCVNRRDARPAPVALLPSLFWPWRNGTDGERRSESKAGHAQ